jgi:hypothetical protein
MKLINHLSEKDKNLVHWRFVLSVGKYFSINQWMIVMKKSSSIMTKSNSIRFHFNMKRFKLSFHIFLITTVKKWCILVDWFGTQLLDIEMKVFFVRYAAKNQNVLLASFSLFIYLVQLSWQIDQKGEWQMRQANENDLFNNVFFSIESSMEETNMFLQKNDKIQTINNKYA